MAYFPGLTVTLSNAMQEYLAEAYRLAYYQNGDPYVSTSMPSSSQVRLTPIMLR